MSRSAVFAVAALKENGLYRSGIFGDFSAPPESFAACSDLGQIDTGDFDFILLKDERKHDHAQVTGCVVRHVGSMMTRSERYN